MIRREFLKTLGLFVALPFIGSRNEGKSALPKMDHGKIPLYNTSREPLRPRYLLTTKEHEAAARAIVKSTWGAQ